MVARQPSRAIEEGERAVDGAARGSARPTRRSGHSCSLPTTRSSRTIPVGSSHYFLTPRSAALAEIKVEDIRSYSPRAHGPWSQCSALAAASRCCGCTASPRWRRPASICGGLHHRAQPALPGLRGRGGNAFVLFLTGLQNILSPHRAFGIVRRLTRSGPSVLAAPMPGHDANRSIPPLLPPHSSREDPGIPLADPQRLRLATRSPRTITFQPFDVPCHPYLGSHLGPAVWSPSKNRADRLLPYPNISPAMRMWPAGSLRRLKPTLILALRTMATATN